MTRPYVPFAVQLGATLPGMVVVGGPFWRSHTPTRLKEAYYEVFMLNCGHWATYRHSTLYDLARRLERDQAYRVGHCTECARALAPKPKRPETRPGPPTPAQLHWALRVLARTETRPCPSG